MITYIVASSRDDAHTFAKKRCISLWRHVKGALQVRYVRDEDTILLAPGWQGLSNSGRLAKKLIKYGLFTDVSEVVDLAASVRDYKSVSKSQADLMSSQKAVGDALSSRLPGFKGGWMSSVMMRRVAPVASTRMIPVIARGFGYVPHPALLGGRTTGIMVSPEGFKRTRLYVKEGTALYHLAREATEQAYSNAQRDQLPIYVNK